MTEASFPFEVNKVITHAQLSNGCTLKCLPIHSTYPANVRMLKCDSCHMTGRAAHIKAAKVTGQLSCLVFKCESEHKKHDLARGNA